MNRFAIARCLCGFAAVALMVSSLAHGSEAYDFGNPTPDEEWMRFLINRARANPEAEADRLGVVNTHPDAQPGGVYDVGEGITLPSVADQRDYWSRYLAPRAPVAWSGPLSTAAWRHSNDMHRYSFFGHETIKSSFGYPKGSAPWDRAVAEGYVTHMVGENLTIGKPAGTFTAEDMHVGLFTEPDYEQRGHRRNMLASIWREVGVGYYVSDPNTNGWTDFWSIDFGSDAFRAATSDPSPAPDTVFVTGTAYGDLNGDGEYQPGEQLPGVRVVAWASGRLLKYHADTADGGGYTIPLLHSNGADVAEGESIRVFFFDLDNGRVLRLPEMALIGGEVVIEDDPDESPDSYYKRMNLRADAVAGDFETLLNGDATLDGQVNLSDLLALADNYGATGKTWLQGDFTLDGQIGLSDLLVLADNYGRKVTVVPEPAAALLLALGVVAIRRRR